MGSICSSEKHPKKSNESPKQIQKYIDSSHLAEPSTKKESSDTQGKVTSFELVLAEEPLMIEPGHRKTSQWLEHQDNNCTYIFGVTEENKPKIFRFDPKTLMISEQKFPYELDLSLNCCATYVSETQIILTGGIKLSSDSSTENMFFYNPVEGTAEKAPSFNESRCEHMVIVHEEHLYIFGGKSIKGKQEIFLKSVERYDIKEKTWEILEDLPVSRAGGFALIYKDKLYVLGGQINNHRIVRTADMYDIKNNIWTEADLNLPQSIAFPTVLSPANDLIQIFGGKGNRGSVQSNFLLDLKEDTFINKKPLYFPKSNGALASRERLYIVGDSSNNTQVYDIKNDIWEERPGLFKNISTTLKNFWTSSPTLLVDSQTNRKDKRETTSVLSEKRCFLFGDDQTQFILECNFTKKVVKEHPIPSTLKLYAYQKVLRLADGKYFICGGINKSFTHVSKNAYLYDPLIRKAKKIGKMTKGRFNFSLGCIGMSIFAIGGQTLDQLGNITTLNTCERFNFEKKRWEAAPNLACPRYNAVVYNLKQKMYLIGGSLNEKERVSIIEMFTEESGKWEKMKVELKIPLDSSALSLGNMRGSVHLVAGRDEKEITDKIWDFDAEQGDMWEFGSLKEPKCGHKLFEFERGKVCIFGGEKHIIELFDMREGKHIEEGLSDEIEKVIRQIVSKTPDANFTLRTFSLD